MAWDISNMTLVGGDTGVIAHPRLRRVAASTGVTLDSHPDVDAAVAALRAPPDDAAPATGEHGEAARRAGQ